MKIENEITGEISERLNNIIRVDIYLRGEKIDNFEIYLNSESISLYLEHNTDKFLGVENTYEGYMQLVKDLGLEMPSKWKKHWIPEVGTFDNELVANFNIFPNKELSEKAANLSNLDRLILLWQYKNDCLFKPNWKNVDQPKHSVIYVEMYKELRADTIYAVREHKTYFETIEQAEKFISVYDKEIKKIMGVI